MNYIADLVKVGVLSKTKSRYFGDNYDLIFPKNDIKFENIIWDINLTYTFEFENEICVLFRFDGNCDCEYLNTKNGDKRQYYSVSLNNKGKWSYTEPFLESINMVHLEELPNIYDEGWIFQQSTVSNTNWQFLRELIEKIDVVIQFINYIRK